jgi:hypothetical protein
VATYIGGLEDGGSEDGGSEDGGIEDEDEDNFSLEEWSDQDDQLADLEVQVI